jgi:hypothetical protein
LSTSSYAAYTEKTTAIFLSAETEADEIEENSGERHSRMGVFGLSEKDKYAITSWAFSYFMTGNISVTEAVRKAVKKIKPKKVNEDGSLKLSRLEIIELQLRVKNRL